MAFSAGHPVREVPFPAIIPTDPKDTDLSYDQAKLDKAVTQFLAGQSAKGPKQKPAQQRTRRRHRKTSTPQGLERATKMGQDQAIASSKGTTFPVYYPKNLAMGGQYVDPPRAYRLRDLDGRKYRAYRMVVKLGQPGEYYGIEGMNWLNPPILASPDGHRTVNGRTYSLYFDGSKPARGRLPPGQRGLLGDQHAAAHADQQADDGHRHVDDPVRRALARSP